MQVVYSVVCEDARMRPDGRVDIEGVFNELQAPGFPAQQDHLVLVAAIEWGPDVEGTVEFDLELLAPGDSTLLRAQAETEVSREIDSPIAPQTRLILPLDEVVFPQNGRYRFRIQAAEESLPLADFHVVLKPDEPPVKIEILTD